MTDYSTDYPRDLIGYGQTPPAPDWPGGARVAVQFVLNIEEGGEACILHGDEASEVFLSDIIGAQPFAGARHPSMESLYEYGARAGAWRLLDLFRTHGLPLTIFAVAMAAKRTMPIIEQCLKDGHEIACHGLRWINYHGVAEEVERAHIAEAVETLSTLCGTRPLGWYTGRTSENTHRLVGEYGGFLYNADDYSDDLPFWSRVFPRQLIVPYTLDTNDMRFATAQGFHTAEQFFTYLRDCFDVLYAEGETAPKMMSVGMHARLLGRPGRLAGIKRFIEHISRHDKVWIARRVDIARHWRTRFPYS